MKRLSFGSLVLASILFGSDEYVEIIPESAKDEATFVVDIPKGKITSDHIYKDITNGVGILFKDSGVSTETKISNELRIQNHQNQNNAIGLKITGGSHSVTGVMGDGMRLVGFNTINSYLIHSSGGEVVFRNLFITDRHFNYITPPESFIHIYDLEKIYIGNGGVIRFEKDSIGTISTGLLSGGNTLEDGQGEFEFDNGTLSFGEINAGSFSSNGIMSTNGISNYFTLKNHSLIEFDSLQGFSAVGIVAELDTLQSFDLQDSTIHFKEIGVSKYALGLGAGCDGSLGFDMTNSTLRFDRIVGSRQSFGIYISNDEKTHNKRNAVSFTLKDSTLSFGTIGSSGSLSIGIGIEQNAQDSYVDFSGWGIVNIEKMRGLSRDYGVEPYGSYVILALGGKVQNGGVRLYYGDYREFDSRGDRAILYARFGEDKDESLGLKYDFASGLVMTTDISTYESYNTTYYSRFRAVPDAGNIYLMHFSSPSNPHAISLNAKEFVVDNFTYAGGNAIGIRLEGKIGVNFMAPKPYFASGSALGGRDVFRLSVGSGDVMFTGYQEVRKDGVSKGEVMYNLSELNGEENAYGIYLNAQGKILNATITDSLSQTALNAPLAHSIFATNGEINLSGKIFLTPKSVNAEHYFTLCNTGSTLTIDARLANTHSDILDIYDVYTLQDDLGGRYYFNTSTLSTFKKREDRGGVMYLASNSLFEMAEGAKVVLDGERRNTQSIVLGESANPSFVMGENAMLILRDVGEIGLKNSFDSNSTSLHLKGGAFVFEHSDISLPHLPFGSSFNLKLEETKLYFGGGYGEFDVSDKRAGMFYSGESEVLLDGGIDSEAMLFTQSAEVFKSGSESKKILLTPKGGDLYGIYMKEGGKKLRLESLELKFKDFYHPSQKTYLIYNPNSKLAFRNSYLHYNKENTNTMIDLLLSGETLYFNLGAHSYMDFSLDGVAPSENGVSFINNGGREAMKFEGSGKVVFEGNGVIDIQNSAYALVSDFPIITSDDIVLDFGSNSLNFGINRKGTKASLGVFDSVLLSLGKETRFNSQGKDYAIYSDARLNIELNGVLSFDSQSGGGIGGSGKVKINANDKSVLLLNVKGEKLQNKELYTLGKIDSLKGRNALSVIKVDFSGVETSKMLQIGAEGEEGLGVGKMEFVLGANPDREGVKIAPNAIQRSDMLIIATHQGSINSPLQNTLSIINTSKTSRDGEYSILAYVKNAFERVQSAEGEKIIDKVVFNNLANGESVYVQTQSQNRIFSIQTKLTRYDYGDDSYYVSDFSGEKSIDESFSHNAQQTSLSPSVLYLVNLNSLNKRLGELRWEGKSGVWARVFGGEASLGEKVGYVSIQAGYDHLNYVGEIGKNFSGAYVGYSYGQGGNVAFDKVRNNAIEAGIYNVFLQDEGFYNDSIVKASLYLTDSTYAYSGEISSMKNLAFAFSNEVGYTLNLSNFLIIPQYEGSAGYFGEGSSSLEGIAILQKGMAFFRNRVGVNWGYDFSHLSEKLNASVYVGTYYVYDYYKGGDTLMSGGAGIDTTQEFLKNDMRFSLNVGSNFKLKDTFSLYFDFEKNFGGKINVDYQVNFGVRYELGEKPRVGKKDQLELSNPNLLPIQERKERRD